jgi:hypothetical protein
MKKYISMSLAGAAILTMTIAGCRKEKKVDNDTTIASDNNLAEASFNEVTNISDAAANGYLSSTQYKSEMDTTVMGCATVILDTVSTPHKIIIDYGPTNCTCGDGRQRRGKIITTFTGRYRDAGTVITHTFDNYFVNNNQIMGTKTVTNMGTNSSGHPYFNISVSGSVIKASGGTITWSSTRVREWIAGYDTYILADDVYLITGSGSGTNASGTNFTVTITSALRIELSCPRIVSGVIDITPSGKPTRTLNYGSGACDNQATVTINGNTYNITLW